jgi:hypothetical protein
MISLKSWCWVSGALVLTSLAFILFALIFGQEKTEKPVLHGKHWIAITGKPMASTAGARSMANSWMAPAVMMMSTSPSGKSVKENLINIKLKPKAEACRY